MKQSEVRKLLGMIDHNRTDLRPATRTATIEKYTDSERFVREKAEIFRKHPLFIGFSGSLSESGDYLALNYADEPLLVVRNREGELRAFLNFCTHRGAPLVEGRSNVKKNFSCPYHAWRYNLDGELVTIPHHKNDFEDLDKSCNGLQALAVEERLGMIFVMPDPNCELNLDTYLEDRRIGGSINQVTKLTGLFNMERTESRSVISRFELS